ncbi:hypothetical protein SFRURICE_003044 [Spodoptera frugiperda]|uniref:SFRICE_023049 n=1 Tax=Spodoptera frugiperda TaxID=7108 RepID=A0A2H1VY49_SPOFR|nr:hypothetical protein SFRURICE_003044 [Spodoptera frugiperda]
MALYDVMCTLAYRFEDKRRDVTFFSLTTLTQRVRDGDKIYSTATIKRLGTPVLYNKDTITTQTWVPNTIGEAIDFSEVVHTPELQDEPRGKLHL